MDHIDVEVPRGLEWLLEALRRGGRVRGRLAGDCRTFSLEGLVGVGVSVEVCPWPWESGWAYFMASRGGRVYIAPLRGRGRRGRRRRRR